MQNLKAGHLIIIFVQLLLPCLSLGATVYGSSSPHNNKYKIFPSGMDFAVGRYLISGNNMTQAEAVDFCQNSGYRHLVAIEDSLEDRNVQLFLSAAAYDAGIFGNAWTTGTPKNFSEKSYLWLVLNKEAHYENFESADEELPELTWTTRGIGLRQDPLQATGQAWYLPQKLDELHAVCERC